MSTAVNAYEKLAERVGLMTEGERVILFRDLREVVQEQRYVKQLESISERLLKLEAAKSD